MKPRIYPKYLTYILTLSVLLSNSLSAENKLPKGLFHKSNTSQMIVWVDSVYRSLTLEEQLAQLIMPIVFPSADAHRIKREELRVRQNRWGGILYQKGLMTEQLEMNTQLQKASKTPMLIALDGEWGLYMRLKDAPRFPRNLGLGLYNDEQLIYNYGREVARECRLMGIHINFAPTVDVNINPKNPVIGSRSFGDNPKQVSLLSSAYALGLEDGDILSVAKHFPGHGDTSEDSHKTLPLVSAPLTRLQSVELAPFKAYIKEGYGGIMTAHLRIPALEPSTLPSSLSRIITTDLLQRDLGFGGLIFTDGLEMKGVQTGRVKDIGVAALQAGNDILLGPSDPEAQLKNLILAYWRGELNPSEIQNKVRKVLAYKYRLIISKENPQTSPKMIAQQIWTSEAKALQRELWQKSLYYLQRNQIIEKGLTRGKYRDIAIVEYGKMSFNPSYQPRQNHSGSNINYISWDNLLKTYKQYDLVLINSYSTQIPREQLLHIAKNRPTMLALYTTPFKVQKESWTELFSHVILTMEACREARQAVLSLITGNTEWQSQAEQNTTAIRSNALDQEDPTANMSKRH